MARVAAITNNRCMSDYPGWRPDQNPGQHAPTGGWSAPTAPPPRPPRRRPGWFPAVIAVGAAALVGIVVVSITLAVGGGSGGTGGHPSAHDSTLSRPASASAKPSPSTYDTLPDPCSLGSTKPKKVAGAKADGSPGDEQSLCSWEIFHSDRTAYLQIELTRSTSSRGPIDDAKNTFADDKSYAGEADNKYEKDPKDISGLGDQAFTAKYTNVVVYGKSEADAKNYHLGGAWVEARAGNAIVSVKWGGASYSGASSDGKSYEGTNYSYATADKQARAIVKYLLGKLS
ncbi:hypothetical protein NUM_39730 [Actinocatenispora comari]|uniref:DUF3558 domain-containing protein n=2 Tax=Actinocatenispora comari TaxID=2807577 RepID=A0A8J4EPG3_9ACTN|nr:hypothetical protein NUM_39730 [Actinocatenispora comari]